MNQMILTRASMALSRMKEQYAAHLQTGKVPFSLHTLFKSADFNLDTYCTTFRPHHHAAALQKSVQAFGESHGIWLKHAAHYITCALYLFPTAHIYRMYPVLQNCAIDFYLNDTMGREVFPHLSAAGQAEASAIVQLMADCEACLQPSDLHPVVEANRQMLLDMQRTSPAAWFNEFLRLYAYHIEVTHRDCNTGGVGKIPTVAEYIDDRCHISGMHHTIAMIEYSEGQFLDWHWLENAGIARPLQRLRYVTAAIGCLMNDLFSFEKEVIDNDSDSNLLMVIALNDPSLSLRDVILQSAAMVRDLLLEFLEGVELIRTRSYALLPADAAAIDVLENHLSGLERCVQASWIWQVHTPRYKRAHSIWQETILHTMETVKA